MTPTAATVRVQARMLRGAFALSLRRLVQSPTLLLANLAIAALPLFIVVLILIATWTHKTRLYTTIQEVHATIEWFLRILYLHFIVFFIANILGSAMMRQEREEQTLHYLFLQPVRRWMLVLGKFGAYMVTSTLICVASLWLTYLTLALAGCGRDAVVTDLFVRGRALILFRESLVLTLGLLAYGTFALLMGYFFKNAVYSLVLLAWEAGLPYLPSTMKFWTLAHYLQSLLPERLTAQNNLFALLGEPATAAVSLAVLLGVSCAFLALSIYLFRYRECLYGET